MRRDPTHVLGYPSALAALARLALDGGHDLPTPLVVLTNAEPLLDHQRAVIAEAFGCPVRDTYGLAELVVGAAECEAGTLHLWPEVGDVECVDGDLVATGPAQRGPCPWCATGRVTGWRAR